MSKESVCALPWPEKVEIGRHPTSSGLVFGWERHAPLIRAAMVRRALIVVNRVAHIARSRIRISFAVPRRNAGTVFSHPTLVRSAAMLQLMPLEPCTGPDTTIKQWLSSLDDFL